MYLDSLPEILTTDDLAKLVRISKTTAWRIAKNSPGFAFQTGSHWKIPRQNALRLVAGETPEQIADSVRRNIAVVA